MDVTNDQFEFQESKAPSAFSRTPIKGSALALVAVLSISLGFLVYAFNNSQSFHGTQSRASGQLNAPSSVGRYNKWEAVMPYKGSYANPNDDSQVTVNAVFTAPSGKQITVPGFYEQSFTTGGTARQETFTVVPGSDTWRVRFAPSEVGNYQYTITLKDSNGPQSLGTGTFTSTISSNPGFVRASGLHLQFDNGNAFIPLGLNAPWWEDSYGHKGNAWGDGTFGIDNMTTMMANTGANFFAFWTCATWAPINIGCDPVNDLSTTNMDQASSWVIDHAVDNAQANNLYMMPTLKHKDQKNFDPVADHVKDRYFVARWGYATSIAMWNWNKEGATNPVADAQWTKDMLAVDPYHHLRTSNEWNHYPTLSQADANVYQQIFSDPNMDISQTHDYTGDCPDAVASDPGFYNFLSHYSASDPRVFGRFGKPNFVGETGVHAPSSTSPCVDQDSAGPSPLYQSDKTGIILKAQTWNEIMSSMGGMTPWMFYFDPGCFTGGTCSWTQLDAYKGASAFTKSIGIIPDNAGLFTSYNDTSQVTVTNANIKVIGRKNAQYAILYTTNNTGLPLDLLRGKTPTPVVNGGMTLKGMQSGSSFTINWFDTNSGAVIKTDKATATGAGLALTLPQTLSNNNIAAYITNGTITPTPTPTVTNTPTPTPTTTNTPTPSPTTTVTNTPTPTGTNTPTPSPSTSTTGTPTPTSTTTGTPTSTSSVTATPTNSNQGSSNVQVLNSGNNPIPNATVTVKTPTGVSTATTDQNGNVSVPTGSTLQSIQTGDTVIPVNKDISSGQDYKVYVDPKTGTVTKVQSFSKSNTFLWTFLVIFVLLGLLGGLGYYYRNKIKQFIDEKIMYHESDPPNQPIA